VIVFLTHTAGLLSGFEDDVADLFLRRAAAPLAQPAPFALAAIDRLPADRPWPWARLDYALLLRATLNYGPKGVVFEMLLNDSDAQHTAFDGTFSNMVDRIGDVTFAAAGILGAPDAVWPKNFTTLPGTPSFRVPTYQSVVWPLETFAGRSAVGLGNLVANPSEPVRSVPLIYNIGGKYVPSLALQAAASFLHADLNRTEIQLGRELILRDLFGKKVLRHVPIDKEGRLRVRYRKQDGSIWRDSFDNLILYADQAERGEKPTKDLAVLRGRQLWVGRTYGTGAEVYETPLGISTPVQIQMEVARCLVQEDFPRPANQIWLAAFWVGGGLLGGLILLRWNVWIATGLLLVGAGLTETLAIHWLTQQNVVEPLVSHALFWLGLGLVRISVKNWLLPKR
jgi:adenylate cyclase